MWSNVTFSVADTQTVTLHTVHGADSLLTMILNVNHNSTAVIYDTIVENQLPYHYVNGQIDTIFQEITSPLSTVHFLLFTEQGCDSVVTMNLYMWPNVYDTIERTICENDLPYMWDNVQFSAADTQTVTLHTAHGADSLITMILNVNYNTTAVIYDTIVENQLPYHYVNGQIDTIFPVGVSSLSTVHFLLFTEQGCDSVVTMSLQVWHNVSNTVDTVVCENNLPITWNGVVFAAEGDSTIRLTGVHGEDSLLHMQLQVSEFSSVYFQDKVCEGSDYTGNGFVIPSYQIVSTQGGHFIVENVFQNVYGCDSVVRLDLEIIDTQLYIVSLRDFCDEQSTVLSVVSDLTDYVWSTGETTASIEVISPGVYTVTASLEDCRGRASVRVEPCKMELRLPNAITPGSRDGLNDCFRLPEEILEQIESFEITIFNRWGNVVFHSKDKNFVWYGGDEGNGISGNVYSYVIKFVDDQLGMRHIKGVLTVL